MSTRSSKLTGAAGAVFAYLKDESTTLAYYDAEEGFSRAWGVLAEDWGLSRGVSREQFTRLFNGQHPDTGEQLAKVGYKRVVHEDGTEEMVATRTGAIDVVYACDKSLSVLYVQASPALRAKLDEVVLNAAKEATDRAVEATAKLARLSVRTPTQVGARSTKQQGSETKRVTADTITLPTIQYTSRPTPESVRRGIADVHVHIHCTTMTLCRAEDRFLTADEYAVKNRANAQFRDAIFQGEIARGLEALGIELQYFDFSRARNGMPRWQVKDVDRQLCRYWSTGNERAWKIRREYEERHGKPIDEVTLNEVLRKTRLPKRALDKRQDSHPNWQLWRDDATRSGFPLQHMDQRRPIEHNAFTAAERLRLRLTSANGLCIDDAVFDEASIRPAIARCAVGLGFSPEELDGFRATLDDELWLVRPANDPERRLYTTRTMLQAELDVARTRDAKAGRWVDITGKAGTGKSALTAVAVDALRSLHGAPIPQAIKAAVARREFKLDDEQLAGVAAIVTSAAGADQVLCVSMAASTAERTGQKIKADAWGSVESVVSRIEKGKLKSTARTLVVIEEAGQLDTLRMNRLLKAVGDAKVVTLGDERQLSAIGGSGWYADSLVRHGSVELTEVRRQKDWRDVEDYALVRDGRAREALESLQGRNRVHTSIDDAERLGRVFQDYRRHREAGRLARDVRIVLDASNQEVDTANRFVQRDRLGRQEISPHGVEVENEEQGRRWRLHENDQVIMLSTVRVKGEDPVKNGTTGIVKRLDTERQRARVKLDDGREVNIPVSPAIGLSYAVHVQKFQGGECPVALCVPGAQTSRNAGYTMLTRGVEESHVYASGPVEELAAKWSVASEKETASAVIARLRQEQPISSLPPVRSDDLMLDDIELDPLPELDPVDEKSIAEEFSPERFVEEHFEPEGFVAETIDQEIDSFGLDG